jgi:hypothetical protein
LDINLEAYDELEISKPDAVRVSLEELHDGGLSLTPDLCQKVAGPLGADSIVDPNDLDVRIDEYIGDRETACLPVGKKLVLLDEKAVKAIREITRNQTISAKDRDDFLAQPTAWINAEYVDLDLGFRTVFVGLGSCASPTLERPTKVGLSGSMLRRKRRNRRLSKKAQGMQTMLQMIRKAKRTFLIPTLSPPFSI